MGRGVEREYSGAGSGEGVPYVSTRFKVHTHCQHGLLPGTHIYCSAEVGQVLKDIRKGKSENHKYSKHLLIEVYLRQCLISI